MQDNRHGFTLLEMILVLLVIGLIAGLTTPVVMSTLDRINRQTSIREVITAVKFARSQAVTIKTPFALKIDLENNQYWLENQITEKTSKVKSLAREIIFQEYFNGDESFEDGTATILFYPQGNTSGGTLTLRPQDDDDEDLFIHIAIDPVTGKARIESPEE